MDAQFLEDIEYLSLVLILRLQGNEVVVYLQNEYLPSLNMPPDLIQVNVVCILVIINHQVFTTMPLYVRIGQVILRQLQQSELKTLKPYLKVRLR